MVNILRNSTPILKLVRWPNLIIVAITQILVRQCLLVPLLKRAYMEPQLPVGGFILLVAATVLITAGGYTINDYFDRKIDRVNRPDNLIVGTLIYPRYAMAYHLIFTISGVILGTWAAILANQLYLALVFIMVSGLLWFYSTIYKREFLLGNIIVALLTGFVPFLVLLFELPLLARAYGVDVHLIIHLLMIWVPGFSLFAFLLNLAREVIKDSEDFEGDRAYGKKTIPVIWGMGAARWIVVTINACIIALLMAAWFWFVRDTITLLYFSVTLIIPLLIVSAMLVRGRSKMMFHRVSTWMKVLMIFGLGYMTVANLIMNHLK
jgi:4-hydroxybenzoate polyprenyltransferase